MHRCGAVNLRSKQSRFYLYLWYNHDVTDSVSTAASKISHVERWQVLFVFMISMTFCCIY